MRRGFTLIEMSIVLVILGLVVAGATKIALPVFDSQKADLTLARMNGIQQSLQVYVIQNGCLPCPTDGRLASTQNDAGRSLDGSATTYTVTAGTTTATGVFCNATCFSARPVVPWKDLGLSEEDAVDGWGRRIGYVVAAGGTGCTGATTLSSPSSMVRCGLGSTPPYPVGDMTIYDNDTGTSSFTNAAYALVSAGPDGALSYMKTTGVDTANRYSQSYSANVSGQAMNHEGVNERSTGSVNGTSGSSHFDDIVKTMTAPLMIQKCGANGCGNPA